VYSPIDEASDMNFDLTKKLLPRQTLNIVPKIREMDALLSKDKSARSVIREIHPEICFWALAGRRLMEYPKKKPNGFLERKRILQSVYPLTKNIVEHALMTYKRKEVARDDILDALAAAVTAKIGFNRFPTIPEIPPIDSEGLSMEMVYFALGGAG
jgi:predicted RNase H-like nuclease